jgi:hypothetical protein
MNKISLSATFILSLATLASTATFAETNTVKNCQLTHWCTLPRTSDVAVFPVNKEDGSQYDCTLSVGGKAEEGSAYIQVKGNEGFNTETMTAASFTGRSAIFTVVGDFEDNTTGRISLRRLIDSANTKDVAVMCEKKFT